MSPILLRRLSDEVLGSRLARGEAAAFDELYRRYAHRLAAYGAHLLGDASAGEDVAHTALLKAYAALRADRGPEHVRPWLYRIAHNTALDMALRRRESPTERLPEQPSASDAPAAGALVAAVAALPERQRDSYVLRELHGLRIDEIADRLALTVPQVEQALFAARNRLAEQLTFGDRLDCVAVRRLLSGPLDAGERRALKPHLRSCPACRSEAGLRGRVAGLLGPLDWLRLPLTGALGGGGAPLAAKATAVVATATLGTAVPLADMQFDRGRPWPKEPGTTTRRVEPPAATAARPHLRLAAHLAAPTAAPIAAARRPAAPTAPSLATPTRTAPDRGDGGEGSGHGGHAAAGHAGSSAPGGDGGPGGGHGPDDAQPEPATGPPAAPPATAAVTTPAAAAPPAGGEDGGGSPGEGPGGQATGAATTTSGDGGGGQSGDGGSSGSDGGSPGGDGGSGSPGGPGASGG